METAPGPHSLPPYPPLPPAEMLPAPGVPHEPPFLPPTPPKRSSLATASLILGIISIVAVLLSIVLGFVSLRGPLTLRVVLAPVLIPSTYAVLAVVLGHLAQRRITESSGRLSGTGVALAGLICGYLGVALTIVSDISAFLTVLRFAR